MAAVKLSPLTQPRVAPNLSAANPPGATIRAPYSYAFSATGTPAATFALTSGNLPPGLSLSDGGLLVGVPSAEGTFTFQVAANNAVAPIAVSTTLAIVVSGAPRFVHGSPPSAVVGTPYSYTFAASGAPTPAYRVTVGTLPAGLTLSAGGVLSGLPEASGSATFTVTADNGVGQPAVQSVQKMHVNEASITTLSVRPPATTTTHVATAGAPYRFTVTGVGVANAGTSDQVATYTLGMGSAFPGSVSGNTITFNRAGTHSLSVRIGAVSTVVEVTVLPGNPAGIVLEAGSTSAQAGAPVRVKVQGWDAYGNSIADLTEHAVLSSDAPDDIVAGAAVTPVTAATRTVTATLGTLTASAVIDMAPVEPSGAPATQPPEAPASTPGPSATATAPSSGSETVPTRPQLGEDGSASLSTSAPVEFVPAEPNPIVQSPTDEPTPLVPVAEVPETGLVAAGTAVRLWVAAGLAMILVGVVTILATLTRRHMTERT